MTRISPLTIGSMFLLASVVVPRGGLAQTETWTFRGHAVGRTNGTDAAGAFMPEVIRLENGTYRMYYATPTREIKYAESSDGVTWTVRGTVLQGSSDPQDLEYVISGPSVLRLLDGRYRMYYQSSKQSQPGEGPPKHHVRSAISSDGITFTREMGVRINIIDYDTSSPLRLAGHGRYFRAADGNVVAIFSGDFVSDMPGPSDLKMGISTDEGLTFSNFRTLYRDWHDPIVLAVNGGYRMYATYLAERQGLAFSPDGYNWPASMTDVRFVDATGNAMTEGNSGVGDIGGVVLPTGDVLLYTNLGNPSTDVVYFDTVRRGFAYSGVVDNRLRSVDFNGDGRGDVFAYAPATGDWAMRLESGSLRIVREGRWSAWTIKAADFNGDRLTDLFLYDPITGVWYKAINTGANNFAYFGGTWSPDWSVAIVELNGDGRSDVFLYNVENGMWFRALTNADGTGFASYVRGDWSPDWQIHPVDFNADGLSDLFLYNTARGWWFRAINDGIRFSYAGGIWDPGWEVFPADLNGDGRQDLFLYNSTTGLWFRVLFDGTTFSYSGSVWSPNWAISVGDFNGDSRHDLFLYNPVSGVWFKVLSTGAGGFTYTGGLWSAGWRVSTTDFNGDGRDDLFLYDSSTRMYFQVLSTASGEFAYAGDTVNTSVTWVVDRP